VDMDAFYASVEELERPELKTKPMAVGSLSMLSTANYEARKFGVRSALPGYIALKLCPELIILPLDFEKYTRISQQVRTIFAEYDPNYCPMSLDEGLHDWRQSLLVFTLSLAYLDITAYLQAHPDQSPSEVAQEIRQKIFRFSSP
jgi:DNA polymerase kappa